MMNSGKMFVSAEPELNKMILDLTTKKCKNEKLIF